MASREVESQAVIEVKHTIGGKLRAMPARPSRPTVSVDPCLGALHEIDRE
jgi:hypothetical protein